jgi:hypothetical protein
VPPLRIIFLTNVLLIWSKNYFFENNITICLIDLISGGDTPLHIAAKAVQNSFEITQLLLSYEARVTTTNDK